MRNYFCPVLCSTTDDVDGDRSAAAATLLNLKASYTCVAFWDNPDELPEWRIWRIGFADLLVIILGNPCDSTTSIDRLLRIKAEYNARHEYRTPCLIYFREKEPRVGTSIIRRSGQAPSMLEELKAELLASHNVSYFHNTRSLCTKLYSDLRPFTRETQSRNSACESERERNLNDMVRRLEEEYFLKIDASYFRRYYDIENSNRIFVSYSRRDSEIVREIIKELYEKGVYAGFDGSFAVGISFVNQILEKLCSIKWFIVFISKASLCSDWVRSELSFVINRNASEPDAVQIIPVLVDDSIMPEPLRSFPHIDLTKLGVSRGCDIILSLVESTQDGLAKKRLDLAREFIDYLCKWAGTLKEEIKSPNYSAEPIQNEKIQKALSLLTKTASDLSTAYSNLNLEIDVD